MITFMPYMRYKASVGVLDTKRLVRQIQECREIHTALMTAVKFHQPIYQPAIMMWFGFEGSLATYARDALAEIHYRLGIDVCAAHRAYFQCQEVDGIAPPFCGDEIFHASHRAALLYKQFDFYSNRFNQTEFDFSKGYYWPVTSKNKIPTFVNLQYAAVYMRRWSELDRFPTGKGKLYAIREEETREFVGRD